MSKDILESVISVDSVCSPITKPNHSLSSNIKMFVLPPNVLQNIRLNDSTIKAESVKSPIDLPIKDDHVQNKNMLDKDHVISAPMNVETSQDSKMAVESPTTTKVCRKRAADISDNEFLSNATKMPITKKNKTHQLVEIDQIKEEHSLDINIQEQRDNALQGTSKDSKKIQSTDHTIGTIKNTKETTSKCEPKQKTDLSLKHRTSDIEPKEIKGNNGKNSRKVQTPQLDKDKSNTSGESNAETSRKTKDTENLNGRSKRIRKETRFDDYITSPIKPSPEKAIRSKNKKAITITEDKKSGHQKNKQIPCSTPSLCDTDVTKDPDTGKPEGKMKIKKEEADIDVPLTTHVPVMLPSPRKSLPLKRTNSAKTKEHYEPKLNKTSPTEVSITTPSYIKDEYDCCIEDCVNSKDYHEYENGSNNALFTNSMIITNQDSFVDTSMPLEQDALNMSSTTLATPDQDPLYIPPPKKRGRPKKTKLLARNIQNLSGASDGNLDSSCTLDSTSIAETVSQLKRHPSKLCSVISKTELSNESATEETSEDIFPVRKRGRPSGSGQGRGRRRGTGRGKGKGRGRGKGKGSSYSSIDTEYIPKGPNTHTETSMQSSGIDTTVIIDDNKQLEVLQNLIECTRCKAEVSQKSWTAHNLKMHNNMSWRKGDAPMDFENDVKLLRRVLTNALKKRKGQLVCDKCETIKRSVNGLISHMQFCGKSEEEKRAIMMTCSICGAIMMPSSMEIHERSHRQMGQTKIVDPKNPKLNHERIKRRAAEKAVSKILEFTESDKDNTQDGSKKMKLDSFRLKNVIQTPELKKSIPAVWKGIWKKELLSKGIVTCHQVDCTYKCSSFEEICKHYSECNFTPRQSYMCKICKFSSDSNEDMVKHVTAEHTAEEEIDKHSDFEEDDSSDENEPPVRKKRSTKANESNIERPRCTPKFLEKEQPQRVRWSEPYAPALRWTIEFEQENYELQLFDTYTPNSFTLLKTADATKYLPELEDSMRMKQGGAQSEKLPNTEIEWKCWKRFEGGSDEGTSAFFVGGPVWAIAWLPIPAPMFLKNSAQYIAISTHPTMESKYAVGKSYSEPNIIQIWNVGVLDHERKNKMETPYLSYAIAHNSGTVWCLEWCPSGCYQDTSLHNYEQAEGIQPSLRRMGMLAAACSDGSVNIYALPFPEELGFKRTEETEWPIYHTDPVLKLVVNTMLYDNKEQNWQCTKLSWTKEHKHNTIAAGFSNGYIALWDLTIDSPLSMEKRQNTFFVNAFQHFYAHSNAVSMVALVPYNGERFLASGSLDRFYKFWDLENTNSPQSCIQKGVIVDGTWMTHWPCAFISFDDALGYKHTNSYIVPVREFGYKVFPILATNSPTYTIAVSDSANSIAHGTLAGEVVSIFPHQFLHSKDMERVLQKKRQLSSFVKVVDYLDPKENGKADEKKDKKSSHDYVYMPGTYKECKDRFGVIYYDNLKNGGSHALHKTVNTDSLTAIPIEQYPFMSINRISWNPNMWSYLRLVAGYQNGLVRLLNFRHMSVHPNLTKLLIEHAEAMLNKSKIVKEEIE